MKLGELLVADGLVSEEDIQRASEHQAHHGGRLGEALIELGILTEEQLQSALESAPSAPRTVEDTGLPASFLLELLLKVMETTRAETATSLADHLKLPGSVANSLMETAADRHLVEARGSAGLGTVSDMRYALTERGRSAAFEAMQRSEYVGPAPVPFERYQQQAQRQRISNEKVTLEDVRKAFEGLIVPTELVDRLGPAINSARALLMYGPPGNGKTSIAEAISRMFRQTIFVPHCFEVDGQVIKVYDPTVHTSLAGATGDQANIRANPIRFEELDWRWVPCRRPMIITGGELTLDMLDMRYNSIAKYYEAPLQLKVTNGIFVVDDFGRQIVRPKDLINRWIVPLERRLDYLTLHTGKKFPVLFDELVIFSTNFPPKDMMDGAMMRRIPYKIEIAEPSKEDYEKIFDLICESYGLARPNGLVEYLVENFYGKNDAPRACYHPKFLVDQAIAICKFKGTEPRLDYELIDEALLNLETAY